MKQQRNKKTSGNNNNIISSEILVVDFYRIQALYYTNKCVCLQKLILKCLTIVGLSIPAVGSDYTDCVHVS